MQPSKELVWPAPLPMDDDCEPVLPDAPLVWPDCEPLVPYEPLWPDCEPVLPVDVLEPLGVVDCELELELWSLLMLELELELGVVLLVLELVDCATAAIANTTRKSVNNKVTFFII